MKKIVVFLLLMCASVSFSQTTATRDLSPFEKIVIIGNFPTEIISSSKNKVEASTTDDRADIEKLSFDYKGNTLIVKYSGSFTKEIGLFLKIYTDNKFDYVEANRGAQITFNSTQKYQGLELYVKQGGKILANNVSCSYIKSQIRAGGSIRLTGVTDTLEASVNAGGTIATMSLASKTIFASVKFGGEIICAPEQQLDAKVSSGGNISYKGEPEIFNQTIKLGGSIDKL